MSAFFVGKRVRLVRPVDPADFGIEGLVVGLDWVSKGERLVNGLCLFDCDLQVQWDSIELQCSQASWQLEPILPDGMKPARWEDCLWQPEHRVTEARYVLEEQLAQGDRYFEFVLRRPEARLVDAIQRIGEGVR